MQDYQTIRDCVMAFNVAHAEERALWETRTDRDLDRRIAEREGDLEKTRACEAAMQNIATEWVKAARVRDAAAKALCEALGIDQCAMKSSL